MTSNRFGFWTVLFLATLCLAPPAEGADKKIIWMETVFPPGYIHEGPLAGLGYEDVITDILQRNLTDYRHETLMGNLARMIHELKQGRPVCNVAFFKTPEREAFMYFSIPSTFTLPNGLITLRKHRDRFGPAPEVRLKTVLADGIRLGISRDRSYGKAIDAVLDEFRDRENVFVHSGKDVFGSLLRMLLSGRLDCMLGLPEEVGYVAEQMEVRNRIVTIPLIENEGTYDAWLGGVACSKTPWGREVIDRINGILRRERPTEQYRGAYERWLDPDAIESYRRLYDSVFLDIVE